MCVYAVLKNHHGQSFPPQPLQVPDNKISSPFLPRFNPMAVAVSLRTHQLRVPCVITHRPLGYHCAPSCLALTAFFFRTCKSSPSSIFVLDSIAVFCTSLNVHIPKAQWPVLGIALPSDSWAVTDRLR